MMRWIVGSSLKVRRIVVAAAVGLMVVGVMQVANTPVDALPEFKPPQVEVQTEALGLSAAEVEELITAPLEQDLLVGVPFLDEIESVSLPGLSSVVMTFEPGTDVLVARQVVQERLTQAVGVAGLPAVAKLPQMIQPLSSSSRASMIKLTSEQLTPIEMSVLARWVIGPRLLGVPGVANISIWGNRDRQLQVLVDPAQLQQQDVTLAQVIATAGNALEVSPLSFLEASTPGTGGFIDTPNQRLNIFHEQAISTPDQLAQVPLERPDGQVPTSTGGSRPTTLGDVARVVEDHQPLIGDTACGDGNQCLLLVVEKFPNANTVAVADEVDAALAALGPGLADMQLDSSVYRPSAYVADGFSNLGWALLAGSVLLLLLLGGFFWSWRRALLVATALGTSTAAAVVVLNARDVTVNLVVVAGLLLGLTAVIDDAVNHVHHLGDRVRRHRELQGEGQLWATIVDSVTSVHRSLLYATLIVAAAAVPLFFLGGEGGAFLPPMALSYLLAVAVSMVVALTVTPALGMLLLARGSLGKAQSPAAARLRAAWHARGSGLVGRTALGAGVFGGVALLGLAAVPFLDVDLSPSLKERDLVVHLEAPAGTSLPRMTGIAEDLVDNVQAVPGVDGANAQVGRAVMSDQIVDVNSGEIWVTLAPGADYDSTRAAVEEAVAGSDAVTASVMTYSDERVQDLLHAEVHDVQVRVYGQDPTALATKAEEIRDLVAGVDGVSAVDLEQTPQQPTLQVKVDLNRAQALGIKPGDVRRTAASLLGGMTVGNLFEEQKVFDVVVWGSPEVRGTAADLRNLRIDTPDGGGVPLGEVAVVESVMDDALIRHESVTRYVEVTADVAGRDVADVNQEVAAAVKGVEFPLDHHAEVISGYADRAADRGQLLAVGLTCLLAIFLLLQAAFRSWRLAALAFVTLPVTLAGGAVAVLLTGGRLGLGAVAGLLAALGLATRGLVLMVRHYQHLERREAVPFGPDLVVRGTGDRLAPTLMSTLGAGLLLLPIIVAGATAGLEILQPAAVTMLGGLVTAAVVNLLVVPIGYLRLGSVPDHDSWADDLLEDVPAYDPA